MCPDDADLTDKKAANRLLFLCLADELSQLWVLQDLIDGVDGGRIEPSFFQRTKISGNLFNEPAMTGCGWGVDGQQAFGSGAGQGLVDHVDAVGSDKYFLGMCQQAQVGVDAISIAEPGPVTAVQKCFD